jgi:ribulose-5-phosphate 4-epimerase/fuculose-1-phosphate aldolase
MTPSLPVSQLKKKQSVRDQVSREEWDTRVNLAACYRLMAEFGMVEMIANHISARVPGTHDQFLINPYGMLYEEMTASSMIKIDIDGNVLFNATEYGINQAGYVIHSAVHAARHEVDCIHTHTLAGMAVSAMKSGILPIAQSSMRFTDIAYHDYEGVALKGSTSANDWSIRWATAKPWCCAITACSLSAPVFPSASTTCSGWNARASCR